MEWLLDMGCSLSLFSVDVYRKIPVAVQPRLEIIEVDIARFPEDAGREI